MALTSRLCVCGMVIWRPGESVNSRFGANSLRWLFDPNNSDGALRFWKDSSGDLVQLKADVFDWKFIENAQLVTDMTTSPNRNVRLQAGADALISLGVPVGNYDHLILFVGGRIINGGGGSIRVNGRLKPAALLDDDSWHNMICHEIGHAIGFDHAFRPSINTGYEFGKYGDPYCIMSASGTTGISHVIPFKPVADIAPGINFWTGGAGLSAATAWRWLPGFPAIPTWATEIRRGAAARQVSIEPLWRGTGTRLAVMRTRAGDGWWTVEYRPAVGWDRGATAGAVDPAKGPGVVIHRLRDLGVGNPAPGYPLRQMVCYERTIPVPSTGDDDWDFGELAVRVVGHGGSAQLLIGETLPGQTAVRMDLEHSDGAEVRDRFAQVPMNLTGPSCGTSIQWLDRIVNTAVVVATAHASGYSHPSFKFTVNGAAAGSWTDIDASASSGQVTFSANVEVPTGFGTSNVQPRTITATYRLAGNGMRLTLPADPGHGAYTVKIAVTAGDRIGFVPHPPESHADDDANVVTCRVTLSEEAKEAEHQCSNFLGHRAATHPPEIPPNLLGPIAWLFTLIWTQLNPATLAVALTVLLTAHQQHPTLTAPIVHTAALALGVTPAYLLDLAQSVSATGSTSIAFAEEDGYRPQPPELPTVS